MYWFFGESVKIFQWNEWNLEVFAKNIVLYIDKYKVKLDTKLRINIFYFIKIYNSLIMNLL